MLVAARGVPCLLPMPCLCAWTSENNSATNLCWLFSTWHAGSKLRTHTNAGMCGAMEGSHSACVLTACTRSDEVPTHPPTHLLRTCAGQVVAKLHVGSRAGRLAGPYHKGRAAARTIGLVHHCRWLHLDVTP